MKKKGFTLVELLAVIAILAILVIMALPAVLNMFTQARIDTFQNEVRTVYRTAQQNYLLNGGAEIIRGTGSGCTKLDMTGNANLQYYIKIDGNGKVKKLQATNGTYHYTTGTNEIDDISIDGIVVNKNQTAVTPSACN